MGVPLRSGLVRDLVADMNSPCQMPELIYDIFLPYHFWRFYDEYEWPFDYTYDEYGEGNVNREYIQ